MNAMQALLDASASVEEQDDFYRQDGSVGSALQAVTMGGN